MVYRLAISVCCLLFVLINAHNLADDYTDEQKEWLANLKLEQLPRHYQLMLQKMSRSSTQSGYCCKSGADQVVQFKVITKVGTLSYVKAVPVSTETACGVFNAGRCHHHSYEYTQKIMTYAAQDLVPNATPCPERHIVCCENHLKIGDSCVDLLQFAHNVDDLIALKQNGFLR